MITPEMQLNFYVDDWGLTREINLATLNLAGKNVLSGVSLLADSQYLDFELEKLLDHEETKIGLHFNLTQTSLHWTQLVKKPSLIEKELDRQYQNVLSRTGRVNYLDGHHHIHLVPLVLRYVENYSELKGIPIRVLDDPGHPGSFFLSKLFSQRLARGNTFKCNYLRPADLKTSSGFKSKIVESRNKPLVIHVSTGTPTETRLDSFEIFRNRQYQAIMELIDEQKL